MTQSPPYGYLLVHFIEDCEGYAEKIYLDISRGDDPEHWEPLNGGQPILASHLGTTGVRDPYLTFNPETDTYYILATDLRVWGGDSGGGDETEWGYWSRRGSSKLIVWASEDLITWSKPQELDISLDANGQKAIEVGMAWAPEATWVSDFHGPGRGAFVLYWSSTTWPLEDPGHSGPSYSRILWGATNDFSQASYGYGGTFIDTGANVIDTTMIQDKGRTYRITKDNGTDRALYMESTDSKTWWYADTHWNQESTRIGDEWAEGNPAGVEGPAVFRSHSESRYYLYVDVIPTGYRPMVTDDLSSGWEKMTSETFFMTPHTKHGGVISLTRPLYDAIRSADASSLVSGDLGITAIARGAGADELAAALPSLAAVTLAHSGDTALLPIDWDTTAVDLTRAGAFSVNGVVRSIGANENDWIGDNTSRSWKAPNRQPVSTTALTVSTNLVVSEK